MQNRHMQRRQATPEIHLRVSSLNRQTVVAAEVACSGLNL